MFRDTHQFFEDELYYCKNCDDKEITEGDIKDWKCINCENRVIIKVGRKTLVRKLPTELMKGEDILLRSTGKFHEIFSVDIDYEKNSCYVNLKGHGRIKFDDQWLNVMWNNNHIID